MTTRKLIPQSIQTVSNHLPAPARDALVNASCEALNLKGLARVRFLQDAIKGVKAIYPDYFRD